MKLYETTRTAARLRAKSKGGRVIDLGGSLFNGQYRWCVVF